ncbi:Tat pathway signal protein [Streptomyces sp. NPDC051677]|uniref:Tat pathway signal protein n=1 Tax=Streptomyces sp. NPDC051677 TaxID=3365669 RepID=UPI0037D3B19D
MAGVRNEAFEAWLRSHQMSVGELTSLVNTAIGELTGRDGTVNDRHIFKLLSGEHRSPNALLRTALEKVTDRTSGELGFVPRGTKKSSPPPGPEDDPLYRRALLTAATAAGVSVTVPAVGGPRRQRLTSNDVEALKAELAAWTSVESMYGGTPELEKRAAEITDKVITLQQGHTASARIRSELYTVAAAFSNSAMWAAIDGRRTSAEYHLDRTIRLAGLSGDHATEFRVWGHASTLFRQLSRPTDALAAAERSHASPITRRDPLFASLAMSRLAVNHAVLADGRSAMRYLDLAQKALDRADPNKHRPAWVGFYDQAELDHLAMLTRMQLRHWPDAERHAHRSLAYLQPGLQRNGALVRANLAVTQLSQRDLEQAVDTARGITEGMMKHARVRGLLNSFTEQVAALAPRSPEARDWQAQYRTVIA